LKGNLQLDGYELAFKDTSPQGFVNVNFKGCNNIVGKITSFICEGVPFKNSFHIFPADKNLFKVVRDCCSKVILLILNRFFTLGKNSADKRSVHSEKNNVRAKLKTPWL